MAGGGCPNLNGLSSGAQSKMGSTLNFIYLDNEITIVEVTAIALLRSGKKVEKRGQPELSEFFCVE